MTHREKVLQAINQASGPVCDDCLTKVVGLKIRQDTYARCNELERAGSISRGQGTCTVCAKVKFVSVRLGETLTQVSAGVMPAVEVPTVASNRPWYWEGNVQAQIVSYLVQEGYSIRHTANTASKEAGKDIVATSPDGRELWVSVKGYPTSKGSTNTNTQARHWFSHVVFDMVLYRGENATVDLAIGLPEGYKTYLALAERVSWFRQSLPFWIFWVRATGEVRVS